MNMNMPSGAPVSPQIFKEASWRHMPACDVCPARRRNGKSPRECGSVELLEKTKLAETPQAAIDMRHADSRKSCAGKIPPGSAGHCPASSFGFMDRKLEWSSEPRVASPSNTNNPKGAVLLCSASEDQLWAEAG